MTRDIETQEWLQALDSVVEFNGTDQAQSILQALLQKAQSLGLQAGSVNTPYLNTISAKDQAKLPENEEQLLQELEAYVRWNAICIVMRAAEVAGELGGHIASFASTCSLYTMAQAYFIHGPDAENGGDLVYFQGHSTEGNYALSYLEGRFGEKHLDAFRQEESRRPGLSSYPHPWLMPDYWQFPTVSMGLGPLMAIYHAHFLNYLSNRDLKPLKDRKIWVFAGDGEMNEPESLGALNIAGREKLDNLIFVISCNLQRLDGLVNGNGQIMQEYEAVYRGAGWNVIKVVWGSGWDELLAKDQTGLLSQRINELCDGEYQAFSSKDGAYFREKFFGKYPELLDLVSDKTDEQLEHELLPGGHDFKKLYAAYHEAVHYQGKPTVILAHTIKGFGMGQSGQGKNVAHNVKKMTDEDLQGFCQRFNLPLSENQVKELSYAKPNDDNKALQFHLEQRKKLGGFLPQRRDQVSSLPLPDLGVFKAMLEGSGEKAMSSTMAFVRILGALLKDKELTKYIVPITSDEARTFGMEGLFRQIGVYSYCGQKYEPEDRQQLMYYREAKDGQFLEEGISEAGCMATWIAAGTSYANNQLPMIPFFIYYSMFGYQRFGDLVWAAGDIMARGFIIGATAGRTTLAGEGLQHNDGHNILLYSVVPNCVSYDPTYAYEMAVIIRHGLKRMYQDQDNVFFYITAMNENYQHPPMPEGSEEGIVRGMYELESTLPKAKARLQLLGSGAILNEVRKAAEILEKDYQIGADVWSVTSFNELRKDAREVNRYNLLHPEEKQKTSYVRTCLADKPGPVVAATDYIKLYADQIRSEIDQQYVVLGTDGFGRSDTRVAGRDHFEVDAKFIVYTALNALAKEKQFDEKALTAAIKSLGVNPDRPDPGNL